MTQKQESPAGDGGAFECLARRLDTSKDTQTVSTAQGLAGPRFERRIKHIIALGERPLAELLTEIATVTSEPGLIADRLQAYVALDPEIVRFVVGGHFPKMPMQVVP